MKDPDPSNIRGEKRVSHSVEWKVNVGYALLALAAMYAVWKVTQARQSDGGDLLEPDESRETTIPIGGDRGH